MTDDVVENFQRELGEIKTPRTLEPYVYNKEYLQIQNDAQSFDQILNDVLAKYGLTETDIIQP